jgi:hypothetical protein
LQIYAKGVPFRIKGLANCRNLRAENVLNVKGQTENSQKSLERMKGGESGLHWWHQMWTTIERIKSLLTGKTIIKRSGSATLIGEPRDGGYYYLKSPDLPGFTFLISPEESEDIEKLSEAIKPALSAYLAAHIFFEKRQQHAKIQPRIYYADLSGAPAGKPMNLIAELCNP